MNHDDKLNDGTANEDALSNEDLADALAQADVMARLNTSSEFENAAKKTIAICFAIQYVLAIAIYMLLRHLDAGFLTDLWIALVFAVGLYGREKYVNIQVKREIISKAFQEIKDEVSKESKDVEEGSTEQS